MEVFRAKDSTALQPGRDAILIVDNIGVGRQSYHILSQAGYRVYEAGTTSEAMDVLDAVKGRVSLVMIDVAWPAIIGIDLGERIRNAYPDLRLILAVPPGFLLTSTPLSGRPPGLLSKPFAREELLQHVAGALGESRDQ